MNFDRRACLATLALAPFCGATGLATARSAAPEISAAAARSDLLLLQRALTELHPGLYRYASPEQFDHAFAQARGGVAQGCGRAEIYLWASRLAALAHCGHTWANRYNQRADVTEGVLARADKLPLTLRFVEGRALVTASAAPEVRQGAELLAIDGRSIVAITAALLPLLHADGRHAGARGKRLSQLDSGPNGGAMDRLFPLCFPTAAKHRALTLREPGAHGLRRVSVPLVKEAERALPAPERQWQLRVEGDTGVLTLPTFAFWDETFKPQDFIDRSFATLRDLPFLVIDQRHNEGGDDAVGRMLLAQLLREPYDAPAYRRETAHERIPADLKQFLGTWDERFFDRSGQVRRGPGRNWSMAEREAERVLPAAAPYRGRTVVLIGPENSSAGFFFARDLKATRAATLIGRPTGGNLRGLNAGQICWVTLPASGVAVDIPLVAHFAADGTPDGGITPDVAAAPSFGDAQAGTDTEMAAAQAQIARWRERH